MSVSLQIWDKIKAFKQGNVFCANDFDDIGTRGNIDVILHRLSVNGSIRRLGYGLYDIPLKSKLLGNLTPRIDDILSAYSRRMGQVFVPDPLNSANLLGITTQIPSKLLYLTNGKTHTIDICGLDINFIHTSSKKLVGAMTPIGVVIQALRYFGSNKISDAILKIIANHLNSKDLENLLSIKSMTLRNLRPQIERICQIAAFH